uniref:Nudix hydrolase domain-containing protein n=1 Tax=Anopheles funestus TaxID=62324 RepID=A0A182RIK0_ANOFN
MLKKASELLHPGLLTNVLQQGEIISRFQAIPSLRLNKEPVKKEASILIPLCLIDDKINLLYTVRSSKLRNHRGQVSFPGGMKDTRDSSYESCAVREFEEETGISKNSVNVWGRGKTIIPYFGPSITPIVGNIIDFSSDQLRPSSDEVAKVFTVPIESFACAENRKHTQFRANYTMPVFQNGHDTVWGITAIITHMFLIALLPGAYTARLPFIKKYEAKPAKQR